MGQVVLEQRRLILDLLDVSTFDHVSLQSSRYFYSTGHWFSIKDQFSLMRQNRFTFGGSKRRHDTQHNDIQYNATQHNATLYIGLVRHKINECCNCEYHRVNSLSVAFFKCYAECHYSECFYAECDCAEVSSQNVVCIQRFYFVSKCNHYPLFHQ